MKEMIDLRERKKERKKADGRYAMLYRETRLARDRRNGKSMWNWEKIKMTRSQKERVLAHRIVMSLWIHPVSTRVARRTMPMLDANASQLCQDRKGHGIDNKTIRWMIVASSFIWRNKK